MPGDWESSEIRDFRRLSHKSCTSLGDHSASWSRTSRWKHAGNPARRTTMTVTESKNLDRDADYSMVARRNPDGSLAAGDPRSGRVLHGPDDEAALRRLAKPMPMTSKSAADAKDWHEANLHAEGGFACSQKVLLTSRRRDRESNSLPLEGVGARTRERGHERLQDGIRQKGPRREGPSQLTCSARRLR